MASAGQSRSRLRLCPWVHCGRESAHLEKVGVLPGRGLSFHPRGRKSGSRPVQRSDLEERLPSLAREVRYQR